MNIKMRRVVLVPFLVLMFGLAVTILLGLAPVMPARAAGPICYVGPDFTDDYATIGEAIDDKGCMTIFVDLGVYNENLTIDRALTIRGPSFGSATINGGGTDRVLTVTTNGDVVISRFYIYNGNQSTGGGIRNEGTLRLNTVTVRDNKAPGSTGGGIWNSGTLTVSNNSSIYNNTSEDGAGIWSNIGDVAINDSSVISNAATDQAGGVLVSTGSLVISDSDVVDNKSVDDGGGVYCSTGILTITGSTVMSNTAGSSNIDNGGGVYSGSGPVTIRDSHITANSAGGGGGVYAACSGGNALVIENSTISGNEAVYVNGNGGGVFNVCDLAILTDVTISGNTAGRTGGGIHNQDALTLTNVTISGNEAPLSGGINSSGGVLTVRSSTIVSNTNAGDVGPGGIQNYATASFQNTIFAYNDSPSCANSGTLTSNGYNMETSNTCGFGSTGDQVNTDPNLGPLEDNGGDTFTHALPEGSPAIEAGSCSYLSFDQRGKPRPTDLPGVSNVDDGCDIGAFEIALEGFLPLVLRDF